MTAHTPTPGQVSLAAPSPPPRDTPSGAPDGGPDGSPVSGPGRSGTGVVAVVPLRDGVSGKSRLATGLTPHRRRLLVAELARHVVGVLTASPQIASIVVVTADPAFTAETLGGLPVRVLAQPADRPGLNAALDVAREAVRAVAPAAPLLVAHADLPDLTPDDVAAVLAARQRPSEAPAAPAAPQQSSEAAAAPAASGGPCDPGSTPPPASDPPTVVVATDRHGTGTNLLLVPADTGFTFRFGPGSRAAHEVEAARRGLHAVVVDRPGTAADLDTLDDWDDLPAATRDRLVSARPDEGDAPCPGPHTGRRTRGPVTVGRCPDPTR